MRSARHRTQQRARRGWLPAVLALNAFWVTDLFILGGGPGDLSQPGALLNAMGRLTGLYGALALAVQLILIARIPGLERRIGMDRLTRWHRWTGFSVLWLVLAHVMFITLGYAAQAHSGVLAEIDTLLFGTRDVLKAAVATGLLVLVAVTSVRRARRRIPYESWHFAHLYAYLAVALAFLHQVTIGRDFIGTAVGRAYWWSLFGAALGAVLWFRLVVPLARNLRHRLRVVAVVPEGPGVVSIYIRGRQLDRLRARAGQFFLWRFLTRDLWPQAHPYSLSSMPDGSTLRITVKALGDGSTATHRIRPGTRVLAEGPYGAFTSERRTRRGVLLIGGGVGITPIRALLEEFAETTGDVVVIYRVNELTDAVLWQELDQLAARCGATLQMVSGPPDGTGPHGPLLGWRHLTALVPHIRQRDVYVCGPPAMTAAVLRSLRAVGVRPDQCHAEQFAFAS